MDSNTDPEHPYPDHLRDFYDLTQSLPLSSVEPNDDDPRRAHPFYELLRELDISFDDHLFGQVVENIIAGTQVGPEWAGWTIRYLGLRVDVTEEEATTQYEWPHEWPRVIRGPVMGDGYFDCIQVRIWSVNCTHNPLTAERRWTPYGRYHDSIIIDSRRTYKPLEFKEISRGFDLLSQYKHKQLRARGRRPGWRKGQTWDRDAFIDWKVSYDLDGKTPRLSDLAEALGVKDDDTARQRLRDLDPPLPWPPDLDLAAWDSYQDGGDE